MANEEQGKAEGKPADNKKLFIIIGAAAAAVVVIAVVAIMMLGGGKEKGKEGSHGAKVEQKAKGEGGHGGGEGAGAGSIHPLEPFIVNIYDGQEIRYLKVKVEFGTTGPDAKAELDARQAPLRDAILVLLTTKTLQDIQDLQGKNQLRAEILTAVNKIVPPGKISQVYFTDFVVQ